MARAHACPRPSRPLRIALRCAAVLAISHVNGLVYADGIFSLAGATLRDGGSVKSAQVFNRAGCNGENRSPELTWRNPPAGTRSFAVTMFDPDAPGPGWWHWAVADIPASVTHLPENASASGALKRLGAVEARDDFDVDGYAGPCPPPGKPHRYVITVYALGAARLGVPPGRPALMFDHEISASALGHAQLTVTYGR